MVLKYIFQAVGFSVVIGAPLYASYKLGEQLISEEIITREEGNARYARASLFKIYKERLNRYKGKHIGESEE